QGGRTHGGSAGRRRTGLVAPVQSPDWTISISDPTACCRRCIEGGTYCNGAYPRQNRVSDNGGQEGDTRQVRRNPQRDPFTFDVVVSEGKGETRHHVTMSRELCERLTAGKHTPERCLEAAFRFLLDREPKESILRRFDVTEISRYFPEFEREVPHYLAQLLQPTIPRLGARSH